MISEARKKILLDMFGHPTVLFPVVAGLTAAMIGWVFSSLGAIFFGAAACLIGAGTFATRLTLGQEELTKKAYRYIDEEKIKKQNSKLDALDYKLKGDRDPRTHRCLRELRHLHDNFQEDVQHAKGRRAGILLGQVKDLFEACITQLEHSYDLYETYRKLSGNAKSKIVDQRESVVQEVTQAVEHLGKIIEEYHAFQAKKNKSRLTELRQQLDQRLRIAKEIDEELNKSISPYDEEEFLRES